MNIAPEIYLQKRLWGHRLLSDVPLLDVWAISLANGGTGRTVQDIRALVENINPSQIPYALRFLFRLREVMGAVFRWDREANSSAIPANSYFYRLDADDMARSLEPCGTRYPPLTLLYQFDDEILLEIINATTHAFILLSLEATSKGYYAYVAVYAQDKTWWSPYYMRLIDPFRHWVVYPTMIRLLQQQWETLV